MKPQRFTPGQAVTPKKKEFKIEDNPSGLPPPTVRFGEIYHVEEYRVFWNGNWYMTLTEQGPRYEFADISFDPVDLTTEQIAELVEESLSKPVEI